MSPVSDVAFCEILDNGDATAEVQRFTSSKLGHSVIGLQDCAGDMVEGQEDIIYASVSCTQD